MAPLNNHIWVCHSKYSPFCTVCTELFDVEDIVTLKSGLEVTQGHRKWYHSKAGPRRNIAIPFWTEKLEWCGYLMAKKVRVYAYPFWQNTGMWQTDGWTDFLRWHSLRCAQHSMVKIPLQKSPKCPSDNSWKPVNLAGQTKRRIKLCNSTNFQNNKLRTSQKSELMTCYSATSK